MLYEKQEDADKRKRSQNRFSKNKFPPQTVTKEFQLPPLKQSSESTQSNSTHSSTKNKSITIGTTSASCVNSRSNSRRIGVSHSKHDSQPNVNPYTNIPTPPQSGLLPKTKSSNLVQQTVRPSRSIDSFSKRTSNARGRHNKNRS